MIYLGRIGVVRMKDNIDKDLDFLDKLSIRLFYFASLMVVISVISPLFMIMFNKDIAIKVLFINILIGIIPLMINILFFIILFLIECIIYGED